MKARILCVLGAVLSLSLGPVNAVPAQAGQIVNIPDAALRDCFVAALTAAGLPSALVDTNLAMIDWLSCGTTRFQGIHDLTGMEHLTSLENFNLVGSTVTNLTPLAGITDLHYIHLDSSELRDGSPLTDLADLRSLELTAHQMSDVGFVAEMTSLGRLSLVVAPGTDFTPVGSLSVGLNWLELSVDDAAELPVIETLDHLYYLTLVTEGTHLPNLTLPESAVALILKATNLSSLKELPDAPQLVYLEVIDTPSLVSLQGIGQLTGLREAVLRNHSYSDLSPLSQLTGLHTLDISGNAVVDLKPISGLTALTELRLNANPVRDLSPLGGLTGLKTLDASFNNASDVSALSKLTSLEWLSLAYPAKDLGPIARLSELRTLYWPGLDTADLSPLAGLQHLTTVYLPNGTFTTLGPTGALKNLTEANFSNGRLTSVAALAGAGDLARLDLSQNRSLSDIRPLAGIGKSATVNLSGDAVKDLSPLPDTVTVDAGGQTVSFTSIVDAAQPLDLGIRSLTGVPLCATFRPTAPCSGGVVTFPTRGYYAGSIESEESNGLSVNFTIYVGPDRPFTRTHAPEVAGPAKVGIDLYARVKEWVPEVDHYSYQWYRDGALVTGDGSAGDRYVPRANDRGHRFTVCVTGTRTTYLRKRLCSSASAKVVAGTVSASKPKIVGSAVTDSTLTAIARIWPEDVEPRYQWQRNHKNIRGATTSTFQLRPVDVGAHIRVRITGSKVGFHSLSRYSASVVPKKAHFATARPTITGATTIGQTLTAVPGAWTPLPSHLSYQWYRNGKAVKGATLDSLILSVKDLGATITVRVNGTRAGYVTKRVYSLPTAKVA